MVFGMCAGLIGNFIGSISRKRRFLYLHLAQINGVTERRGAQRTSHGVQVMVSRLNKTFRFRSANNASYYCRRHGGVTHKGQGHRVCETE